MPTQVKTLVLKMKEKRRCSDDYRASAVAVDTAAVCSDDVDSDLHSGIDIELRAVAAMMADYVQTVA